MGIRDTSLGVAYLFDAATGERLQLLNQPDDSGRRKFGASVAIEQDLAIVGGPSTDFAGGEAYVFDAASGQHRHRLIPHGEPASREFGRSLAIADGVVLVGAPDYRNDFEAAYLFDATTGEQVLKLVPDGPGGMRGFGESVAIGDGLAVVGSPWHDENGVIHGAAYVFDAVTGQQLHRLLPPDGSMWDSFGSSVAIDEGLVLVGSSQSNDLEHYGPGAAYVFDAGTGAQILELPAPKDLLGHQFGASVALDGRTALIGAPSYNHRDYDGVKGSAYLLRVPEPSAALLMLLAAALGVHAAER